MSYISSNDNRFYVALEQGYGNAAAAATSNRIPAVKLTTKQQTEKAQRKDMELPDFPLKVAALV
jgi:hypothetical protein